MQTTDWLTLGATVLGAIWLVLLLAGILDALYRLIYSAVEGRRIPDTVPEMFPEEG